MITKDVKRMRDEIIQNIKMLCKYIVDEKTGLIKKEGLGYFIEGMHKTKDNQTLFLFGLKGLKEVNDHLGHHEGDDLIKLFGDAVMSGTGMCNDAVLIAFRHDKILMITKEKTEEEIQIIKNEVNDVMKNIREMKSDFVEQKDKIGIRTIYTPYDAAKDDPKKTIDVLENSFAEKKAKVKLYTCIVSGEKVVVKFKVDDNGNIHYNNNLDIYICSNSEISIETKSEKKHEGYDEEAENDIMKKNEVIKASVNNDDGFFENVDSVEKLYQYYKELYKNIFIDEMTGFFNKNYWDKRISYRDYVGNALITFDVNDLRKTNIIKDFETGNKLVKVFAKKVDETFCDNSDIKCRTGGDEFKVITKPEGVMKKMMELYKSIESHNANPNREFNIKVSYGHVIYDDQLTDEKNFNSILEKRLIENKSFVKQGSPDMYLLKDPKTGMIKSVITEGRNEEEFFEPLQIGEDGVVIIHDVPDEYVDVVRKAVGIDDIAYA